MAAAVTTTEKKTIKMETYLNVFIFICCNHLYAVLKIKLFWIFPYFYETC